MKLPTVPTGPAAPLRACRNHFPAPLTTKLASLLLPLLISGAVQAQKIAGHVRDEKSAPVPFATIVFRNAGTVFATIHTDSSGYFEFLSGAGAPPQLAASFSHIGFRRTDTSIATQGNAALDILLKAHAGELKAVSVSGKTPLIERKVDRLVLHVENKINTAGLNTIDLLNRAPLLLVRNESVSIIGRSDCAIYLNDRPLNLSGAGLAEYLKNIPVEQVVRIEVITNPSARYEASGSGGIVNIVTRKPREKGYWGNASLAFSMNRDANVRPGLNLNVNGPRVRYFAGINLGYGSNPSTYYNRISYPQHVWESNTKDREYSRVAFVSTGLETELDKRTELALSVNALLSRPDKDISSDIRYSRGGGLVDSLIRVPTEEKKTFRNFSSNLHLKRVLDSSGRSLTLDVDVLQNAFDYGYQTSKSTFTKDGQLFPNSVSDRRSQKNQDAAIYSINAAYEFKIGKLAVVTGAKLARINNTNEIDLLTKYNGVVNTSESDQNTFRSRENFQSLFAEVSGSKKKWEYQFGLRYEHGDLHGLSGGKQALFRKQYNGLFPSVNLLFRYADRSSFSFGFGRRYSRPSFAALNPYKVYYDYFYYQVGNPGLLPYYANNMQLSHTYKGVLTSTLMYSFENGAISYITTPNAQTNVQVIRPENGINSRSLVLDENVSFSPAKWLQSSNGFTLIYNKTFSSLPQTLRGAEGLNAMIKSTNAFKLSKSGRVSADLSVIYNSGGYTGLTDYRNVVYTDIAARFLLTKTKRIQLNVGVRDLFKSRNSRFTDVVNGISTYNDINNGTRRFTLNVRYVFGNNKLKKARGYSSLGSEQNRIN